MEYVLLIGGAFVLAVYGIWRVRRGGSHDDPDRMRQGLPDDLREKVVQPRWMKQYSPGHPEPRRVSRNEGDGKDGGG
jgi:hypothetical protein